MRIGSRLPSRADPPCDLEPVESGHEDVEDHRVGLVVFERGERGEPVVRELDLVALELERAAERLAHRPFVVHDQDLHGSIVRIESEKSLRARTLREFLDAFRLVLGGAGRMEGDGYRKD